MRASNSETTKRSFFAKSIFACIASASIALLAINSSTSAQTSDQTGREYLGTGINVIEYKYHSAPERDPIINLAKIKVRKESINSFRGKRTYGSNFEEFATNLAISVGLKGSYGNFSGSLQSGHTEKSTRSLSTKFVKIGQDISAFQYSVSRNPDVIIGALDTTFKTALENASPADLFKIYGTHVMTSVKIGGMTQFIAHSSESEQLTETEFKIAAEAKYDALVAKAQLKTSITQGNEKHIKSVRGDTSVAFIGGTPTSIENGMKTWSETVRQNPAFLGPRTLVPIWVLTKSKKRSALIKQAFKLAIAREPVVRVFQATSTILSRPDMQVRVPTGYKLLSGGGLIATNQRRKSNDGFIS